MITYSRLKTDENRRYAEIPLPGRDRVSFSLRAFLSLRTLSNRSAFYRELGIEGREVYTMNQGHTREVIPLGPGSFPVEFDGKTADGWVTAEDRHIIGVTVADCVPILIYDTRGEAFGLVHSGWKGTGILENALRIFTRTLHRDPARLQVCMGPAIRSCCYKVSRARAHEFAERFGENTVTRRAGGYFLDLCRANINICEQWGVKNILLMEECTACDARLGSYRGQGPKDFTRMLVLCGNLNNGLQGD